MHFRFHFKLVDFYPIFAKMTLNTDLGINLFPIANDCQLFFTGGGNDFLSYKLKVSKNFERSYKIS